MSPHLPECPVDVTVNYRVDCCCHALRAVRARTLAEASRAIKMQRWSHRSPDAFDERLQALAAIDALRGESKVVETAFPPTPPQGEWGES